MSQVVVITDSSTYLSPSILKELNIEIIPLTVIWDGESYAEGVDITPIEFYARLATSDPLPSTSLPSAAAFKDCFNKLLG